MNYQRSRMAVNGSSSTGLQKWPFIPYYSLICSELWFSTWLLWYGRT